MPSAGKKIGRKLLASASSLCSTTSRYNNNDTNIDDKIVHILSDYLKGGYPYLPSEELMERVFDSSCGNHVISLGYGLELTKNFVLTATEFYRNVWCTIIISPDGYSAHTRGGNIDLRKYPIYDLMNILVVQRFLAKTKEKFTSKKIR